MNNIFEFEGNGFSLSKKEIIRILRFSVVTIILLTIISCVFGVGIASAETGIIGINSGLTDVDYIDPWVQSVYYQSWTNIYWYTSGYNYIKSFKFNPDCNNDPANQTKYTTFTISSGGTGGGTVWYDKPYVYFEANEDATFTSSPITISLVDGTVFSDFSQCKISTTYNNQALLQASLSASNPVSLRATVQGAYHIKSSISFYDVAVSAHQNDNYVVTYSYPYFNVSIDKTGALLTKYFFESESIVYGSESTFNSDDIVDYQYVYEDGIYINATLESGLYTRKLINSTIVKNDLTVTSDIGKEYEITDIYVNQPFYVNTWINNTNWAVSSWYLKIINPDNSFYSGWGILSQVHQSRYTFYDDMQVGTYKFEIRNIYTDVLIASNTLVFHNEDWIFFDSDGKTNDNNIDVDWYINPLGWNSDYMFAGVEYFYTDEVLLPTVPAYNIVVNVTPQGSGNINLASYITARNYFDDREVMLKAYIWNTLTKVYVRTDYLTYQHNGTIITPTPIPTPYPTPNITATPQPTYAPPPDPDNFTKYNGTGMENVTGYMENVANSSLGNINAYTEDVNTQISSYDYSTHKSILSIFLPAILNMFPAKVWGLIILALSLELALIILRR